jgi:hypothetical protein
VWDRIFRIVSFSRVVLGSTNSLGRFTSADELQLDRLVAKIEAVAVTLQAQLIGPLQCGAWTRNPS